MTPFKRTRNPIRRTKSMNALRIVFFLAISLLLISCFIPIITQPAAAESPFIPPTTQGTPASKSTPLVFVENIGQFDKDIRFQVRGENSTIFFTDDALWISIIESSSKPNTNIEMERNDENKNSKIEQQVNLKLSFRGANPQPQLEPFQRLDTQISFFTGDDPSTWQINAPTWSGVRYVDIYPGIDLEISSQNGQLTQRLVVQEDASLLNVNLRVEGVDHLALDGNHLLLTTPLGNYVLPLLTVEGSVPQGEPRLSVIDNVFQVSSPFVSTTYLPFGAALTTGTTSLRYSTYLGGSSNDVISAITLDNDGNVYITGKTASTEFPTTPGTQDRFYSGDPWDVFVSKLSADGSTLLYSTYLGGIGEDIGNGIVVDTSGNVYIAGNTQSTNFPTTPGAFDNTLNGGRDAFVAKLNTAGNALEYSTYLGGNNWDYGFCIDIDDIGNVYIGGFTQGSFPITPGAAQTLFGGSGDGFISQLNPNGSALLYSTYLGGSSWEGIEGITIDSAGNAYLASHTHSTDFPTTPGAWDRTCDNCQTNVSTDGVVAKLSADGSEFVYSTLIGGADASGGEEFTDIAIDNIGNVYLTGSTTSTDFPTTSNVLQPDLSGEERDAVVVKLNEDGSALLYSTYLGGSGIDRGYGIDIDNNENAFITGYTVSTDFSTVDPLQEANAGGCDAFVSKVNTDGSELLYSTYLGGSGNENCDTPTSGQGDIALDNAGNIYLAGFTNSTDFPVTIDAYDVSFNGGMYDVFVASLETAPIKGIENVIVEGPIVGIPNNVFVFTATVTPITSTIPITYIWEASGQTPITNTENLTDTIAYNWETSGEKVITVTAANADSVVSAEHIITIREPNYIYLPLVQYETVCRSVVPQKGDGGR